MLGAQTPILTTHPLRGQGGFPGVGAACPLHGPSSPSLAPRSPGEALAPAGRHGTNSGPKVFFASSHPM